LIFEFFRGILKTEKSYGKREVKTMNLSENIRMLRTKRNLTQKDLALALSVSPQAVSRWEKGQAFPDVLMLEKLASFFGVTMDSLMGRGAEYVASLYSELAALRLKSKGSSLPFALQECAIYEKLALAGHEQVAYYTRLVLYKRREDRFTGDDEELDRRIASARALVMEYLKSCSEDKRLLELSRIFCIDDEEHLGDFSQFLATGFENVNQSDLLLLRYRAGTNEEKFEKELQYNCYRRVSALLYTIANNRCIPKDQRQGRRRGSVLHGTLHPVSYYETALMTLNSYSKKEWDLFLPHRALIYMNYAAALLRDGQETEGFLMIERLKKTLLLAEKSYLKGEKLRGSVPLLCGVCEEDTRFFFGKMMEIVYDGLKLPEFASYEEDERYLSLARLQKEIHRRVCLHFLKPEQRADFEQLLKVGNEEFDRRKEQQAIRPQVHVLLCRDERVRVYYNDYGKDGDEQDLFARLEKDRPQIKRMVSLWGKDALDICSAAMREKLIKIHPENENAEFLLQGRYRYEVASISDSGIKKT
jgi:transcriptional regulator with XRE-family HTH domain